MTLIKYTEEILGIKLNDVQKHIFNIVQKQLIDKKNRIMYINCSRIVGKTFLFETVNKYLSYRKELNND